MAQPFILGDVCHDLVVCEACERMLELESVYISVGRDGVEGPAWCIDCVQSVLDRAREVAAS